MRRDTLVDFFQDFVQINGTFLTFDDGYRRREYSYGDAGRASPLIRNIGHLNEHYGNLVTYFRIKGMVPPSSRR